MSRHRDDDATIAGERIERLAAAARDAVRAGHEERARGYVRLARRIAERHRLGLPRTLKRFSCDGCDSYLIPGHNARVRTREGHVVVTCLRCGTHARYPYRSATHR